MNETLCNSVYCTYNIYVLGIIYTHIIYIILSHNRSGGGVHHSLRGLHLALDQDQVYDWYVYSVYCIICVSICVYNIVYICILLFYMYDVVYDKYDQLSYLHIIITILYLIPHNSDPSDRWHVNA